MSYTLAYTGAEIDALLGKIDAIFVAEYGSTIYSEVTAAIAAGNKVIVANAGKVFVYAGTDDNSGYVFTQSGPNAAKPNATYVTLSTGNVWSTATVDLATLQQFYASLMEDTASGSIASFPDGAENVPVKELTADIEPIQDLHGQASPYPPNGGKNKAKMTVAGIKSATGGTWTGNSTTRNGITFTILTDSADNVIGIQANGTAAGQALLYCDTFTGLDGDYILNGGLAAQLYVVVRINGGWTQSSTGPDRAVSFTSTDTLNVTLSVNSGETVNNVVFKPMIRLSTEADATFAPYSNICPISGYTGAEIPVTGINVWDEEWEQGTIDATTGANAANANAGIRAKNYIPVIQGQTYYFKCSLPAIGFRYDASHTYLGYLTLSANESFTVDNQTSFLRFRTDFGYGKTYNHDISINYPSNDTDYHSGADNTTYSVSWTDEGTVYKGTAQYKGDGEWEITPTYGKDDMGDLAWSRDSSGVFFAPLSTSKFGLCQLISSMYAFDTRNFLLVNYPTWPDNTVMRNANATYLYCKDTDYTDAATFTTAVTGQTILYELANPTPFTVTGPDPETLLGDNNIWSDTGDISVKYRANTALYIEKKLGE